MSCTQLRIGFQSIYEPILDLFFPTFCISCENRTGKSTHLFCLECQYQVHPLDIHLFEKNPFTDHFKGRVTIKSGAALYLYSKGGRIQQAIEALKYKNRPDIGYRLGLHFGQLLLQSPYFHNIDLITPVPLHHKKQTLRGYNQSQLIAQGLSESMKIPMIDSTIKRNSDTHTQTQKTRIDRMENMSKAFTLNKTNNLQGKHILIVDDILTTGATLEACCQELQKVPEVKISLATIAMGW